jgi:predicted transposase/invertase (TIGR01784 family)
MSGNKISDRPILPLKARKAVFEKLEDIADVASMSLEDRYRDYLVTMDAAEQKGMKEGMEKGIKEGAQKAQLQIARNMKAKGIDNQSIAECTDLPLSMIEEL